MSGPCFAMHYLVKTKQYYQASACCVLIACWVIFQIFRQEYIQCQTIWIQFSTYVLLGLIWVLTVCKDYQHQQVKINWFKTIFNFTFKHHNSTGTSYIPFFNPRLTSKKAKTLAPENKIIPSACSHHRYNQVSKYLYL